MPIFAFVKNLQYFVDSIVAKSPSTQREELACLNHYVWVSLILLPLSIGLCIYNSMKHEYIIAGGIIFFSFYLIATLFLIPKTYKTYLLYHSSSLILLCIMIYSVYADTEQSRILWAYCYPIGTIFLFGNRLGFLYSTLLLGMIAGLFLFVPAIYNVYTIPFQVRFGISYSLVIMISSWFEYHRSRFQKESTQTQYALYLEQALLKEEIERRIILEKKLQYLAQIDPLTSLYNRGYFLELAEKELQRAFRYDIPLCFAILDIDHFKRINDTFGHPIGDTVLQALAKECTESLRETDLMGRLGGEEFAFLLLHVTEEQARAKMEKLKVALSQLKVSYDEDSTLNFTVSIGLAMLTERIKGLDELYIQADEKLYVAKDAGRNCVR